MDLYTRHVHPALRSTVEEFRRLVSEYTIAEDHYNRQVFILISTPDGTALERLRQMAAADGVVLDRDDDTVSLQVHKLAESRLSSYCLDTIDQHTRESIDGEVIQWIGERHRPALADLFRGMLIPIRIANVEDLWTSHLNHPRINQLGECHVEHKPLVIDTMSNDPAYPSGRLIDGFEQLYIAHQRHDPLHEYIDIKDIVLEATNSLVKEDQYKFPSRRMIEKQTAFRSSFGPSSSFGGITGYNRKYSRRKRRVREYTQNTVGKLTDDLLAHDGKTIIPSGSQVRVYDFDEELPDVEFEGKIVNVDRASLDAVFKPYAFAEQLDTALANRDSNKYIEQTSDFERQIGETFSGSVSIVEPDILLTIDQNLHKEMTDGNSGQ